MIIFYFMANVKFIYLSINLSTPKCQKKSTSHCFSFRLLNGITCFDFVSRVQWHFCEVLKQLSSKLTKISRQQSPALYCPQLLVLSAKRTYVATIPITFGEELLKRLINDIISLIHLRCLTRWFSLQVSQLLDQCYFYSIICRLHWS